MEQASASARKPPLLWPTTKTRVGSTRRGRGANPVRRFSSTESIGKIEKVVLSSARELPYYSKLETLPGVGKILGMTITMEVGDVKRFTTDGDFASYCRMVDARRLSNGRCKAPNNQKCGNRYLAWAFVEGANFARRFDEACRKWFDRKAAKTSTVIATKALACKLAKAAWHVMAEDVPYDATRVFGSGKKKHFGETGREPVKGSGHPSQQD